MATPSGQELLKVYRLQESAESSVYLMHTPGGSRYILKRFARPGRNLEMERDFYARHGEHAFRFMHVPRLVDSGQNHLLLEFVDRETHSRDSIISRPWSNEDVALWVDGLLEFQELRPDHRLYSTSRLAASLIYPVIRVVHQFAGRVGVLSSAQRWTMVKLLTGYLACRPAVRYVCTHFDLQTNNYAFMTGERRMSLLDFRLPYYLGDPYLDVLYYVSIPTVRIDEWTFQKRLVGFFMQRVSERQGYNAGRRLRVRLLLLMCNMARAVHFASDPERKAVYDENVKLLLDDAGFSSMYEPLIAVKGEEPWQRL